ncbi:MAG: hypothetical protein CMJ49_00970 [Planctomycetaceae bacterium]|nr:hypothetical protein [Planctomycetaceae bacterium]
MPTPPTPRPAPPAPFPPPRPSSRSVSSVSTSCAPCDAIAPRARDPSRAPALNQYPARTGCSFAASPSRHYVCSTMKYRMLAIDLDGTLLNPQSHVSPENLAAVRRAQDAGVLVVLCTGRGLQESRHIIDEVDCDCPVVLAGGAQVSDPATGKTLHRAAIQPRTALDIMNRLAPHGAVLSLVDPEPTGCDYLIINPDDMTDNTRWWLDRIDATTRVLAPPTMDHVQHVVRTGMVGPAAEMAARQADLQQHFGDALFTQHFGGVQEADTPAIHVLEVFNQGVNKWSGLQWLADDHDIPLNSIAAIGDNINDLAMIQHAACGIAMANAVDPIQALADHVTESNAANGVADAIDQLLCGAW